MPTLAEVAVEHAGFRRRIVRAVAGEAASLWSLVDPARIRQSWLLSLPRLMVLVTGGQRAAANRADTYLDEVLAAQNVGTGRRGTVAAAALAGVASDGRDLEQLLYQPVVAALTGIRRGAPVRDALAGGQAVLDMLVRTQIADAGRAADQVAMVARPQATGYVRLLVGRSCSRCALLAGRRYSWRADFSRHPRCDCTAIPAREDTADDLRTDPKLYFNSLTSAEQDRLFTRAGAEAIRQGADISQVVNARRGMYSASGRAYTTEAATRQRRRLMPEQVLRQAGGDRDEAVRLLKLHRYLT